MASINRKDFASDVILKDALCGDVTLNDKTPTVLSCGGIYIPRKKEERRIIYHVITTSSAEEPVKVMTGMRPRNVLREILLKESMN